jgi:hypothetical protein
MTTKILRNLSLGLIFLTAFIPLYVSNSLFSRLSPEKAFAFRIIVEISFCHLASPHVLRDKKYAPRFSWLSGTITAFLVVTLIADLFGVNPIRSLWSNFERMEGWVTVIHLWAYFLVMSSVFGSGEEGRRMWHNFFRVTLFAAFIVGIYGVVQLAGGAEIHQGSVRIDASLGNAAYMAVYMLVHVFIAFYLGLVDWARNRKGLSPGCTIFSASSFHSLFLKHRLEVLSSDLSAALLSHLVSTPSLERAKAQRLDQFFCRRHHSLYPPWFWTWWPQKILEFVQKHSTLNRLATISLTSDGQARQYIWPMAIKGVFSSPKTALIGWGQENFNYIFNANYNPKMWNQEQWFDRAHNVFLDWLVAGGLIALIFYLALFVFGIMGVWKSELTFAEKCLLTGLFVGYGIHNVFVFDNIASYMLFFTMLGFSHSLHQEIRSDGSSEAMSRQKTWSLSETTFSFPSLSFFSSSRFIS